MLLLHGTADNSVPCENAVAFSTLLKVCAVLPFPTRLVMRAYWVDARTELNGIYSMCTASR